MLKESRSTNSLKLILALNAPACSEVQVWRETIDTYIVVNVAVLEEFYHIRLELYVKRKVND